MKKIIVLPLLLACCFFLVSSTQAASKTIARGQMADVMALAVDQQNQPHLAYYYFSSKKSAVYYAYKKNNQWHKKKLITPTKPYNHIGCADLAVAPNGHVYFVYGLVQIQGNKGKIVFAEWNGKKFIRKKTITPAQSFNCHIAADSQNRPHITHDQSPTLTARGGKLNYAVRNGNSWTQKKIYLSSNRYTDVPNDIATDSQNRPHIIYTDTVKSGAIYAYLSQNKWNKKTLEINSTNNPVGPQIILDQEDNPHVTYFYDQKIYYQVKKNGSWIRSYVDWTTTYPIPRPTVSSLDNQVNIFYPWTQSSNDARGFRQATPQDLVGNIWTYKKYSSSDRIIGDFFFVVQDSTGKFHAAYTSLRGSKYNLIYKTF